jgi:uncharacterized membrane protein
MRARVPADSARRWAAGLRGILVATALLHALAIGGAMLLWGSNVSAFLLIAISVGLGIPRFLLLAPTRRFQFYALVEHGTLIWIAMLAWWVMSPRLLMAIPALASLYMALRIAVSLFEPRTFVEDWSRRVDLDFPEFKAPYCLAVTFLWCLFFAAHSTGILAVVAYRMPMETWLLYAGVGFHVSGVLVLLAEYVFRQCWFRDYGHGPLGRVFAKWLPAANTARGRRSLAWRNSLRYRLSQQER